MHPATSCFLIETVGQRQNIGVIWNGQCVNTSVHSARRFVSETQPVGTLEMPDIMSSDWSGVTCERCGQTPGDAELRRFGGLDVVWNTDDGSYNHPGAMYWSLAHPTPCFHWDNCPGKHLHVVLPNGHPWDIDSRANNCTRPDDRTHRCWVRDGEPPMVTAGKDGDTCSAGAGSILSGDYHGFLQNGILTAG